MVAGARAVAGTVGLIVAATGVAEVAGDDVLQMCMPHPEEPQAKGAAGIERQAPAGVFHHQSIDGESEHPLQPGGESGRVPDRQTLQADAFGSSDLVVLDVEPDPARPFQHESPNGQESNAGTARLAARATRSPISREQGIAIRNPDGVARARIATATGVHVDGAGRHGGASAGEGPESVRRRRHVAPNRLGTLRRGGARGDEVAPATATVTKRCARRTLQQIDRIERPRAAAEIGIVGLLQFRRGERPGGFARLATGFDRMGEHRVRVRAGRDPPLRGRHEAGDHRDLVRAAIGGRTAFEHTRSGRGTHQRVLPPQLHVLRIHAVETVMRTPHANRHRLGRGARTQRRRHRFDRGPDRRVRTRRATAPRGAVATDGARTIDVHRARLRHRHPDPQHSHRPEGDAG